MRTLVLAAFIVVPTQVVAAGLDSDAYGPDAWSTSGISGGSTSIAGDADGLDLSYTARGAGWVSYRTTTFSVEAADDGEASFDWEYSFHHAWYNVHADLWVFADGPDGRTTVQLVDFANLRYTGARTFAGSTSIAIHEGYPFGVIAGGSNFDGSNFLNGTVSLTAFSAPADADDDGVDDDHDACPDTVLEDVVDADGCSVAQICPAGEPWRNHGAYVSCVSETSEGFVAEGLLTEDEADALTSAAARSDVGKPARGR